MGGMVFFRQKFYERSYVLDKKEGEWIWWYSNGKMKYKGSYLNDKKDGNGSNGMSLARLR